jgi:hypothetical protein
MARREQKLRDQFNLPQGLIERTKTAKLNGTHPSGAKARAHAEPRAARLKSCPDTKPGASAGRANPGAPSFPPGAPGPSHSGTGDRNQKPGAPCPSHLGTGDGNQTIPRPHEKRVGNHKSKSPKSPSATPTRRSRP